MCVLASNSFTATKPLKCHGCGGTTKVGLDMVTKMQNGKHRGFYLHIHCALVWHRVNPMTADDAALDLIFKTPPERIMQFASAFANLETPLARLQMTVRPRPRRAPPAYAQWTPANWQAGGGKTNMLVYIVHLLCNAGVSFIVLVYNVAAKDELLSRGLQPHEVYNFHSFAYRAITSVLTATLTEDRIMTQERSSSHNAIKPTVCDIKLRLVAQLYFSSEREGGLLTKLFKTFIQKLADLARTHAFGCHGKPSCLDLAALGGLVVKFQLAVLIEGAWNGVLSQPEKMTLARKLGSGTADARLKYGTAAAAQVLELSYSAGTSLNVMGHKYLFKEATRKKIPLPIIDSTDMLYIAVRLQLDFAKKGAVLVDEAHDLDDLQVMI